MTIKKHFKALAHMMTLVAFNHQVNLHSSMGAALTHAHQKQLLHRPSLRTHD